MVVEVAIYYQRGNVIVYFTTTPPKNYAKKTTSKTRIPPLGNYGLAP